MKLITGAAGSGKTTELIKIAVNKTRGGKKVVIIQSEVTDGSYLRRLEKAGVVQENLTYCTVSGTQGLKSALNRVVSADYVLLDVPNFSRDLGFTTGGGIGAINRNLVDTVGDVTAGCIVYVTVQARGNANDGITLMEREKE